MASRKGSRTRAHSPAKPPKSRGTRETSNVASASQTSARSTVSGPTRKSGGSSARDAATAKIAHVEALAAAFPHNAAKPSEFGAAAREPARGQAVEPGDPLVGASTLVRDKRFAEGRQRQSADELQSRQRLPRSRPCRLRRAVR